MQQTKKKNSDIAFYHAAALGNIARISSRIPSFTGKNKKIQGTAEPVAPCKFLPFAIVKT